MDYTTPGGATVELPKLTIAVARKMNAHQQAKAPEEAWRSEYEFLREALPSDVLADELGGKAFEGIDLSALDVLFTGVVIAYNAPALRAQAERTRSQIGMFDGTDFDKIANLVQAVERMQQMQKPRKGFRAVK